MKSEILYTSLEDILSSMRKTGLIVGDHVSVANSSPASVFVCDKTGNRLVEAVLPDTLSEGDSEVAWRLVTDGVYKKGGMKIFLEDQSYDKPIYAVFISCRFPRSAWGIVVR